MSGFWLRTQPGYERSETSRARFGNIGGDLGVRRPGAAFEGETRRAERNHDRWPTSRGLVAQSGAGSPHSKSYFANKT
jgi:hypothetical protein